jgi:hypothetical protein
MVKSFLCGTDWIINYYVDEIRLQRVNPLVGRCPPAHHSIKAHRGMEVKPHTFKPRYYRSETSASHISWFTTW